MTTAAVAQEQEYSGPHRWQTQGWARIVRALMRQKEYMSWVNQYCTSVTTTGTDNLADMKGPVIFIPNHQSHMDTPVIMSSLPRNIQNNLYFGAAQDRWFLKGKEKLILQPWYQSLVMGNFPIMRGGGSQALDHARWLLDQQCNLCIFPEGTRATSNELGKFRHGVTLLAREKQVPIVPVVLKGLHELRPKGARQVTPGPVSVSFLKPIQLSQDADVPASTHLLWETMNREFFRELSFPKRTQELNETTTDRDTKAA